MRESEAGFRGIFGSAGIGMAVVDMQGRLIESNPALQTMLGYSEIELAGMGFTEFTHPDDVDSDVHLFTELVRGKRESYQIEKRYIRKDGQIVWGMLTASLVRSPSGEPQYCLGMAENITEHKRAEAARRESEQRFRILFECSPDGYCLLDVNGAFLDLNRASEELVGCRREGILGKTLQEAGLLAPDELERAVRLLAECAQGEPVDYEEFRLLRKDGETVAVEIGALPIETAAGRTVLAAVRDITRRKRVEQALRESEESSRTIIETAPDGVYIVADTGQIIEVNEAACRQLGHSREHLLQSRLSDIIAPRFAEIAARRLQEGASGTFETAHIRADGSEVPLELSARHFIFRGQPARLGIARDISERKQAEREHTSLKLQLQRAQKLESIGRLAGGVAHDFNNLLTVINGYSELVLKELQEGDPLRDHVGEVRKAGERAAGLTRQLLLFSRQRIVEPRPLNLNTVVAEAENMLRRLLGEDIELVTDLAPSLGEVMADPGQFHQVLMNLAVNARDAMPDGGRLTLKTANTEMDENFAAGHPEAIPGPFVMLAVSDTGTGIEEEIQGRIFDPFFTTKPEGEGTGLGLSTVYGIVRQCGGTITVISEPGQGATFQVYLPRTEATIAIAEMAPLSADKLRGSETILVVEDQESVRRFAVHVLKNYGYRTLEAAQGGEAMLLAERYSGPIDLMLTDVVMPLITGSELVERLRPMRPRMRVLYMSGHAADHHSHRELLDPGVLYIAKPFTSEALAAKVRDALEGARPAATVMVVDDEDSIRSLFALTLARAGYKVVEAKDGKEASTKAQEQPLDLLITDLVMPEREGIELIKKLRTEQPALKIIAVSGAFGDTFLKVAKALGANATLAKPVSSDELLATAESLLTGWIQQRY